MSHLKRMLSCYFYKMIIIQTARNECVYVHTDVECKTKPPVFTPPNSHALIMTNQKESIGTMK